MPSGASNKSLGEIPNSTASVAIVKVRLLRWILNLGLKSFQQTQVYLKIQGRKVLQLAHYLLEIARQENRYVPFSDPQQITLLIPCQTFAQKQRWCVGVMKKRYLHHR
jgi:hypothetical protein